MEWVRAEGAALSGALSGRTLSVRFAATFPIKGKEKNNRDLTWLSRHHPHPILIFRRDPKQNPAHTVGLESDRGVALTPCV